MTPLARYVSGEFCSSDVEQHGHQGDGKDGKQGGNECQLGDERGVSSHLQAEDGTVGSHGHGDDHGVDVHRQLQPLCQSIVGNAFRCCISQEQSAQHSEYH